MDTLLQSVCGCTAEHAASSLHGGGAGGTAALDHSLQGRRMKERSDCACCAVVAGAHSVHHTHAAVHKFDRVFSGVNEKAPVCFPRDGSRA